MSDDHFVFQDIETGRLLLRNITIDDVNFIFSQFSNPIVSKYLMDEPAISDTQQAKEIISFYVNNTDKTHNRWIIIEKESNLPIGTCGFHKWDKRYLRAEIGYDLNPHYWGKGYMKEALSGAINFGFIHMKLNRIDALVYINNERSNKLLQRLGFTNEGRLRDYFCLDGTFYDHLLWALLRREWEHNK